MADGTIAIDEPTTIDKMLDTESLTVGANTVQRERVRIAGAAATDLAGVTSANGLAVDVTRSALPTGASTSALQTTGNTSLSSIDGKITAVNTGAVVVSSSALPSGAATAAKQPALGTAGTASADVITVQGKAGMTAVLVDGSAVTQPVSLASQPLPTGASTAVKQPALGTAGAASADVITVQGIASMTALKVDGSAVTQPVSGTVTANPTVSSPKLANALSTTAVSVKASAGTLQSYYIYNPNAVVAYVQVFDIASGSVVLGTSVPKWSIGIPPTSAANLASINLTFATAISVAATTTATGLTALGTAVDANFGFV